MRFTLVYQGPLSASGNSSKKPFEIRDIREKLDKQLKMLWDTHHALQALKHEAWEEPGASGIGWGGPSGIISVNGRNATPMERATRFGMNLRNLAGEIPVGDVNYTPLVRKSLHLACELDVLFLRQDDPGSVVTQGGDLDNRLKTLLDALRMPSTDEIVKAPPSSKSLHCLMESDTLVSAFNVDSDRLLLPASEAVNEVQLVIGVSIRVLRVNRTNVCLL